ncbi:hypothetical protein JKF63_04205 [Porcisia hertigi]|uniref:Protein kinase domain-containing protein n=1 Tax=Porcisia hertigi TaxID=2761500 RepID=A0A836LB69_9TRYP|nr:hypothetical protein JKF63_04205 [Porcisia hertigi]
MLPHPILASEDDEEYVIRVIFCLPPLLEAYFDAVETICAELSPQPALKTRADVLHLTIKQRLLVLGRIPFGAFRHIDEALDVETEDKELPKLIDQLRHVFLENKVDIGPQALLWRKRSLSLAKECADHINRCRVRFSSSMKMRRELVTLGSAPFVLSLIFFGLIVIFACSALVVLPAVQPPLSIGLVVGCLTCVFLLLSAFLVSFNCFTAVRSLHILYTQIFHEYLIAGGSPSDILLNSLQESSFKPKGGKDGARETGVKRLEMGRETKSGYYTIPYGCEGEIGYIEGKQLNAQVVMIAFDGNYRITWWNNAAEVMTGFLQDGCIGKPLNDLVQCFNNEDVCSLIKHTRRGNLLKIKLRSLTTAPTTLSTVVAPILDCDEKPIGNVLICANSLDNLREYRIYVHNYQVSETIGALSFLSERSSLSPEDSTLVNSLSRFVKNGLANHVETLAREMESDWDWTSVEQLLGRALGQRIGMHEVIVDPLFPSTLCVSPDVAKTLGVVVGLANGRCRVTLQMLNLTGNVFSLSVTVLLGPKCRPWDQAQVEQQLEQLLRSTAGSVYLLEERVVLHFPCQVAPILEDGDECDANPTSDQALKITQARAIINCTVNVVTAITNMVDQHNLSLILLKTMFVSLATVRERSDLEQRLSARPCDVDVIICDSEWLSSSRDILMDNDHGAIVIPLIAPQVPVPADVQHAIRIPLVRRDVQQLILEVGKAVSMKKNAISAREERERILTLRQDSPWTRGKLLGRGSFGAVYEATSDLTGGKMAVKMFYFSQNVESSINTLLNEISIMCSLNHPNIVHYFHCERNDNNVSLFMELCEASLTDIIVRRLQKPAHLSVVQIIRQVLTAIAYLHSRGIAHRDVKPQNILLKGETVKLTDFGTAVQGNAGKEVRGTFRYMAPEVYKGDPHSLSCDIWSIGCLVCELFACPTPFMENSLLLGEMTSTETYLANVPQNTALIDFLEKCFQLDPERRWGAGELLMHPLLSSNPATSFVLKLETIFDAKYFDRLDPSSYSAFSLQSA